MMVLASSTQLEWSRWPQPGQVMVCWLGWMGPNRGCWASASERMDETGILSEQMAQRTDSILGAMS